MATLFSYNPNNGAITPGIALTVGQRSQDNKKTLPPHLRVGDRFIQVDKAWKNVSQNLTDAGLKTCYTGSGKRFQVFDKTVDGVEYVFIDSSPVAGVRSKYSAETVNAFEQVVCAHGAELLMSDRLSGTAFIALPQLYAEVQIWRRDGTIHQLVRREGEIVRVPLGMDDVARLRIAQFEEQLSELDLEDGDNFRKVQGILNGALRLAKFASDSALDRIVNFLCDHRQRMSEGLRGATQRELESVGHVYASSFGYGDNVFFISAPTNGRGVPTARKAKRAERSADDRAERQQMRGASDGGTKKRR